MSKYLAIQKRIDQMKKAEKGSLAPSIGLINKINEDYTVYIGFWDGKQYSDTKQKSSITKRCSSYNEAEEYIVDYLKVNKPSYNFILFTNEEDLYD